MRASVLLLALTAAACASLASAQLGYRSSQLQHFDVPGWDGAGGPQRPPTHSHGPPVVYDTPDDDAPGDGAAPPPAPQLPPKPAPPPAPVVKAVPAPAPAARPPLPPGAAAAAAAAAANPASSPQLGAAAVTPALVSAAIELRGPDVAPWTPKAEAALTDGVAFMLKVPPNAVTISDVKELAPGPPATPGRRSLRQSEPAYAGTSLVLSVATTVADAGAVTEHLLSSTAGTGELATALGTRGVQPRSAAVLRTDTVVLPPPSADGADGADGPPKPSPRVSTKHAVTAAAAVLAVSFVAVVLFMSLKRWLGGRDGGAVSAAEAAKATADGGDDSREGDADAKPPARTASGAAAFFLNARSPRGAARTAPAAAGGDVESHAI